MSKPRQLESELRLLASHLLIDIGEFVYITGTEVLVIGE
jgi:hypothetical protein